LKFKLKKAETTREILTESEVERIEKMHVPTGSDFVGVIRDMFLFSCYTGLRFSDLQAITGGDFVHDGDTVYMSITQEKTDKPVDIPLHALFNGKALAVYEKYRPRNNSEQIFPKYTNQAANRLLKIIAVSCQIDKPLTFHIGRHTFGTLIAKFTGDQFLIQNLMGHADIKTSQVYIHLSKKHIEDKLKNGKW
jgi:integrase